MRQFAIGFIGTFIIVFVGIWAWMLNNTLALSKGEEIWWIPKLEMIRNCDVGTLAILGDSIPALDLLPSHIGPGVVNLAVGGATPVEYYLFARGILSCPNLPKAVLISFSTWQFNNHFDTWKYMTQYNVSGFDDLDEVRQYQNEINNKPFSQRVFDDIGLVLQETRYTYRFPPYYFSKMIGSLLSPWDERQERILAGMTRKRGGLDIQDTMADYRDTRFSRALSKDTRYDHFTVSPEATHYFEKLIDSFGSRNIPVYYLILPTSELSIKAIKPGFISEYVAYLNGMASKHHNFHLLTQNYAILPVTSFCHDMHLNENGAKLYSDQIREMLKEMHAEGGPFIPDTELDTVHQ